jgi:hypothetical protein
VKTGNREMLEIEIGHHLNRPAIASRMGRNAD